MTDNELTIIPHGDDIIIADSIGNSKTFQDVDEATKSVELWLRGGVLV